MRAVDRRPILHFHPPLSLSSPPTRKATTTIMPPQVNTETAETGHLPTLVRVFLDFASKTRTEDDPVPFCWPEFQERINDIPPWSPAYAADGELITDEELAAIKSLVRAYYAPGTPAERTRVWNAARNNVHRTGRTALNRWMAKKRAEWKFNSLIDNTLEEAGVTLQSSALSSLTAVRFPVLVPD